MEKKWLKLAVLAVAGCLCVKYSETVFRLLSMLLSALKPLLLGCMLAYVLNIFMKRLESIYFPKKQEAWVEKTRRPVCVFGSVLLVLVCVVLFSALVIPALVESLNVFTKDIPTLFERFQKWVVKLLDDMPGLQNEVQSMEIDWNSLYSKAGSFLSKGIGGLFNSVFSFANLLISGAYTLLLSVIFAIYLLFQKETLKRQAHKVLVAYFPERWYQKLETFLQLAHESFTSFITGQLTEAVIIGTLCAVGLLILRVPYAVMVGVIVGVTALIPVVGAYLGAALGAFMILTVSPTKALVFIIYLIILQQVEDNLIYPKVVGNSIGLPGMWVLASVTVGGGLLGVVGMLLGVPLAATLYKWFGMTVNQRLETKEMTVTLRTTKQSEMTGERKNESN
jgi:predicted PurR-regulated permease PerM